MREMGYFGVQNQHFFTFLCICSLPFSEIRPADRDQKVGTSAGSKCLRKIHITPKMGEIGHSLAQNQDL